MCIMVSTLAVARRLKLALVSIAVTKCCARAPRTDVVSRTNNTPRGSPRPRPLNCRYPDFHHPVAPFAHGGVIRTPCASVIVLLLRPVRKSQTRMVLSSPQLKKCLPATKQWFDWQAMVPPQKGRSACRISSTTKKEYSATK